jgi:hypothetical protein
MLPPEAGVEQKTVEKIAARSGLPAGRVSQTLKKLEDMTPPLVHRDVDAKLNIEFWIALEAAIEALEDA